MLDPIREIALYLPSASAAELECLSLSDRQDLREIRMKCGCPMLLTLGRSRRVCGHIHTKEEVDATFRKICASSSYSHRNEIRAGYVTLPGGHRVGIVGSAVIGEMGKVEGMRDIVGFSFRVARDCAISVDKLYSNMCVSGQVRNLLIVGPPCSGKTTVLRSLARRLAEEMQVAVIDEREELFPGTRQVPIGCDVLRGFPKAAGILQALRTLAPSVIVCDEIGTEAEVSGMADGLRSGVALLASAHAYTPQELIRRPPVRRLISLGGVDVAAFLDREHLGSVCKIMEREELCAEVHRFGDDFSELCGVRSGVLDGFEGAADAVCANP